MLNDLNHLNFIMKKIAIFTLCLSFCLTACKKDDYAETDEQLIQDYIAANNLDAESTEEGVYYVIESEGTGERPTSSSTVEVHYEGFLLNGTKFDSSIDRGETLIISLNNVIAGWRIGIPLFKEGGRGTLIIPSRYAYGANGQGTIPSNSVLIFDIDLRDVQ